MCAALKSIHLAGQDTEKCAERYATLNSQSKLVVVKTNIERKEEFSGCLRGGICRSDDLQATISKRNRIKLAYHERIEQNVGNTE